MFPLSFCVMDVWDVADESTAALSSTLSELGDLLLQDAGAWTNITSNYVFDKLYSVAKFWTDVGPDTHKAFFATVTGGLNAVLAAVDKAGTAAAADDNVDADADDADDADDAAAAMASRRNAFKMFVFLLTEGVLACAAATAKAAASASGKSSAAVPKSARTAQPAMEALLAAAGCPFGRMWSLGVAEEEFVAVFHNVALKVVASAPMMKSRALRKTCVELVALALHKFPTQTTSAVVSITHMLQSAEHASTVVADVLQTLVSTYSEDRAVADVLREVGNMDGGAGSAAQDTAGLRNVSAFLVDLSARVPEAFLSHLEAVLPHLDGEAYSLRSAVVACLGNVVAAKQEGSEEELAKIAQTKELLLDVMQERVRDVHAFTRAAVLRAWSKLLAEGCIPLERYHVVTQFAAERLSDKAAVVRKTAVQLLTELLLRNPFAPKLTVAVFKARIEEEDAWLEANPPAAKAGDAAAMDTIAEGDEEEEEENEDDDADDDDGDDGDDDDAAVEEAKDTVKQKAGVAEEEGVLTDEHKRHLALRAFCGAALKFAEQMAAAVPVLCQLMGSKTATDAVAAMRFLAKAKTFALDGCDNGLRKMLTLVWSSDTTIRDAVLDCFRDLYLLKAAQRGGSVVKVPQSAEEVADNLVALASGAWCVGGRAVGRLGA